MQVTGKCPQGFAAADHIAWVQTMPLPTVVLRKLEKTISRNSFWCFFAVWFWRLLGKGLNSMARTGSEQKREANRRVPWIKLHRWMQTMPVPTILKENNCIDNCLNLRTFVGKGPEHYGLWFCGWARVKTHFHFGLLGLHFLSFWPFGLSFPFILAFWAFISFHFVLLAIHFLSF